MKNSKRKNRTNFGSSLQSYRLFFDISQDDLAGALKGECTAKTISAWERGTREPDFGTLVDLAAFFQTTTDCILGREGEKVLNLSQFLGRGVMMRVGRVRPFPESQYTSFVKILKGFLKDPGPSKGKKT